MPTPPVQMAGSPFQVVWSGTTTPKSVVVGTVGVGDLIVYQAVTESSSPTQGAPSNTASGPATITWTARGSVTTANRCKARCDTGIVTVAGNLTVNATNSPAENWGFIVWVFPAATHGGVGQAPAGANGAGTAPTLTATWSANSMLCCANGDFTAVSHGATRSYRTGAGAASEDNYSAVDGNYTTEAWHHADTGAGGSQAVGLTTPTMTWSILALEVLGFTATATSFVIPRPPLRGLIGR